MNTIEVNAIQEFLAVCKRVDQKKILNAYEGNVSVCREGLVYITTIGKQGVSDRGYDYDPGLGRQSDRWQIQVFIGNKAASSYISYSAGYQWNRACTHAVSNCVCSLSQAFTSKQELVHMIEHYIQYYNSHRVQNSLGFLTPMEKHERFLAA